MFSKKTKMFTDKIEALRLRQSQLEEELKTVSNEMNEILKTDLPNHFIKNGFNAGSKITTENGMTLELKKYFKGTIIDPEGAYRWLEDNNHDSIITNELKVPIKGNEKLVNKLEGVITKYGLEYERKKSVNWKTLDKFTKDLDGNLPNAFFSVDKGFIVSSK